MKLTHDFFNWKLTDADKARWAPLIGLEVIDRMDEVGQQRGDRRTRVWMEYEGKVLEICSDLNHVSYPSEPIADIKARILANNKSRLAYEERWNKEATQEREAQTFLESVFPGDTIVQRRAIATINAYLNTTQILHLKNTKSVSGLQASGRLFKTKAWAQLVAAILEGEAV